ncbi:hypothetical protein [[Clostridium] scindens]|nr:hypothetical protein [[Clostridium] scindens]
MRSRKGIGDADGFDVNFVLGLPLQRRSRNSSRQGAEELLMDVDRRKCF